MRCTSLSVIRLGPPYRRLCQFRLEPSSHRPRWRPDGSFVLRLERVAFLCPQSIARLVGARKRTNGQCPNGRGKTSPTDEDSRATRALHWNSRSASSRHCLCESETDCAVADEFRMQICSPGHTLRIGAPRPNAQGTRVART